jgi:hypothetical protein
MKKLLLVMVAGAVVVLGAAATGVAAAEPGGLTAMPTKAPDHSADIYGNGGGKVFGGVTQFAITGHEGPNGDFGHANVTTTSPSGSVILSFSADIDCVQASPAQFPFVEKDNAVMSGVMTKVSGLNTGGFVVGDPVVFILRDGGNPSGAVPVDDFYYIPGLTLVPSCRRYYASGSFPNVTQGNVNIKPGPPLF